MILLVEALHTMSDIFVSGFLLLALHQETEGNYCVIQTGPAAAEPVNAAA